MRLRNWIVSVVLLAGLAGATGFVLAREPDSQSAVTSQQLFAEVMAREPGKEVNAQAYTFAPGAVLPWQTAMRGFIRLSSDWVTWRVTGG